MLRIVARSCAQFGNSVRGTYAATYAQIQSHAARSRANLWAATEAIEKGKQQQSMEYLESARIHRGRVEELKRGRPQFDIFEDQMRRIDAMIASIIRSSSID